MVFDSSLTLDSNRSVSIAQARRHSLLFHTLFTVISESVPSLISIHIPLVSQIFKFWYWKSVSLWLVSPRMSLCPIRYPWWSPVGSRFHVDKLNYDERPNQLKTKLMQTSLSNVQSCTFDQRDQSKQTGTEKDTISQNARSQTASNLLPVHGNLQSLTKYYIIRRFVSLYTYCRRFVRNFANTNLQNHYTGWPRRIECLVCESVWAIKSYLFHSDLEYSNNTLKIIAIVNNIIQTKESHLALHTLHIGTYSCIICSFQKIVPVPWKIIAIW